MLILGGILSSVSAQQYETAKSTVNLKVYVVAISGVAGGHGFGNLSSAVAGAVFASNTDVVKFYNNQLGPDVYYNQPVNITTDVVTDWNAYETIVVNESNAVVVNAHADILPVPQNYTKEAWVSVIADAVANRNITWVHTGGYPFYYYQPQDGNETLWGQNGFTLFMNLMGIPNVTCNTVLGEALYNLGDGMCISPTWGLADDALNMEGGYSLNCSDFEGKLTMATGGYPNEELMSVVNFAGNKLGTPGLNSGYYVHVGALKTFDANQRLTNSDYMRSYLGTAVALYNVVFCSFVWSPTGNDPASTSPFPELLLATLLLVAVMGGVSLGIIWRRRRSGTN